MPGRRDPCLRQYRGGRVAATGVVNGLPDLFPGGRHLGGKGHLLGLWFPVSRAGLASVFRRTACARFRLPLVAGLSTGHLTGGACVCLRVPQVALGRSDPLSGRLSSPHP